MRLKMITLVTVLTLTGSVSKVNATDEGKAVDPRMVQKHADNVATSHTSVAKAKGDKHAAKVSGDVIKKDVFPEMDAEHKKFKGSIEKQLEPIMEKQKEIKAEIQKLKAQQKPLMDQLKQQQSLAKPLIAQMKAADKAHKTKKNDILKGKVKGEGGKGESPALAS